MTNTILLQVISVAVKNHPSIIKDVSITPISFLAECGFRDFISVDNTILAKAPLSE